MSERDRRRRLALGARRLLRAWPPLVIVVAALIAASPLFGGQIVLGHDALEHPMRTAEYARLLAAGVPWPQWSPNLGHGYGEPIFLFNPPLFYALASVPTLAGLPVVSAVNLTCVGLLIAAGLGTYAWTAPVLGRAGGLVAGVAYAWAPYVLLDLYVRQALTELTAVCILPWALAGLDRAVRASDGRRVAVGALGVAALLLSSTPATVVTAPALLGQVAASGWGHGRAGWARGLAALALGGLLASAFWVPAAAERHLLRFDRLLIGGPAYVNHFLEPWQLVSSHWGYGTSQAGSNERLGFGFGEAQLILTLVALVLLLAGRARGLPSLAGPAVLAVGLVGLGSVMALDLSAPLWAVLSPLRYLQFPWRFLMLPALGCALLAGLPVALLARRRPRAATLVALACVATLLVGGWQRARPRGLTDVPQAEFEAVAVAARDRLSGTAYEYETIWTEGRPKGQPEAPMIVRSGAVTIAELPAGGVDRRFAVSARGRARLRLNTFYFPGWRVLVNGQEQAIDWSNPSGLIEFSVERGEHLVEARFGPTPPRLLGGALSGLGLATVLALIARTVHGNSGAGRTLHAREARVHRRLGDVIRSR